ncbi:Wzz/FepE/Etk N-terminal domain-containing protein [Pseudomonas sp. NPDC089530]|uniref:Wzz/FepE/Etk N-terminal domain-containing protein n=1 Tax=Pseudomonas sp. NPDC089530 TaxID=3390651 RepID=UPI003D05EB3B
MNIIPQPQINADADEIDLYALFQSIWQQKKLVIGCALAVTLAGLTYAVVAPRIYEVSSVLRPAALNELDALNRSEVYKLPPADALSKVGAALESYETRLEFFREHQDLFQSFKRPGQTLEQSFEDFNRNSINLILPDPKKPGALSNYITLEMQYPNDVDGVAILNGFVDYAINAERARIGADLKVIVKNRLNELKGKIAAARSNYDTDKASKIATLLETDNIRRGQLEDERKALRLQLKEQRSGRLAELAEAISIAKSMGIRTPTTPSSMSDAAHAGSTQVMRTEVNNRAIPLYFMGYETLEAERTALQKRTSDDFTEKRIAEIGKELQMLQVNRQVQELNKRSNEDIFLKDVFPLRAEMARLRNLNIDMDQLKLVTIDRKALQPVKPIKPRTALITASSLVLGLVLGVILALLRHLIRSPRKSGHDKLLATPVLLDQSGKVRDKANDTPQ